MYYHGRGALYNYKEAFVWYWNTADKGNAKAQFHLDNIHPQDQGVPLSFKEPAIIYWKLAGQGDSTAQYNLGPMY